jgi:high-affinity Fe2+/Pb2+ permease
MFQAFVIVSREAIELLLILIALREWARQAQRPGLGPWIAAGVIAGFAAAAAVMATLPETGMNEWLDIALTCGFGLSVALLSCGTMASMAGIGAHATSVFDNWFARRATAVPVLAFVAFSALREALEAFLLIRFVAAANTVHDVAWGVALGLAACALLAGAWQALATSRRTQIVFRLTAVLLFIIGIQMMLEAITELLLRGVAGPQLTHVGHAMQPYMEEGERYWLLCAGLAGIPLVVWMRAWWRRAGTVQRR